MNAFYLKLLCMILMLLEHIGSFIEKLNIGDKYILYSFYTGRIVAPIFTFLTVESYFKTSSFKKYISRMIFFAFFTMFGSNLIIFIFSYKESLKDFNFIYNLLNPLGHNIFLSYASGLLILKSIEKARKQKVFYFVILLLLLLSIFTEGNIIILFMYLIFYYSYSNKKKLIIYYTLLCIFMLILFLTKNLDNYQFLMIFALPFIISYDGKRGYNIKYLFYIFYPLHIWILFLLSLYWR